MKDNKSISQLNINLPEGKELYAVVRSKVVRPNYYQLGSGMNKKLIENNPIDAITKLLHMTPQEAFVIETLKDVTELIHFDDNNRYYSSNIVSIAYTTFSNTNKVRFSIGYKRLRGKDLVRRIKRQEYIINPNLIIPTYYEKEIEIYYSCK